MSDAAAQSTLFENVRVFDGRSDTLMGPTNVLGVGKAIASISAQIPALAEAEVRTVVDGEGRVLMPGLIDAHTHMSFATLPRTCPNGVAHVYHLVRPPA